MTMTRQKGLIRMILSCWRTRGDLHARKRRMTRKINSKVMITLVMTKSLLANLLRGGKQADTKAKIKEDTLTKMERICLKRGTG
jgi:hypothetical protein